MDVYESIHSYNVRKENTYHFFVAEEKLTYDSKNQ